MGKRKILAVILMVVLLTPTALVSAQSRQGGNPGTADNSAETEIYCDLMIEYHIEGTKTPISETYRASMLPGSSYSVDSPIITGYQVTDESQQTVAGILNEDTEITVQYTAAAKQKYTIQYTGLEVDGGIKEVLDQVEGKGAVGDIITAEDKIFEGYIREPGSMSLVITADGNAALNINYVQVMDPCIIFSTGGDYVAPIVAEAGSDIQSLVDSICDPERQGYVFTGWDVPDESGNYDGITDNLPGVMPDEDLVVRAVWSPGISSYTAEFYFQDTEGDGYTRNEGLDEQRQATTESMVTASDEDREKGITIATGYQEPFYGFDYSHCENVQVAADGKTVLKIYYNREIWTVNLYDNPMREKTSRQEFDGMDKTVWMSFSGRYGAPLPETYPAVEELKKHYADILPEDWAGYSYTNLMWPAGSTWSTDGERIQTTYYYKERNFASEDTPGQHILNLYPFYTEGSNTFYFNYYVQDLDLDSYSLYWERVEVLTYPTVTFNVAPINPGFTLEGGFYREKVYEDEWPGAEENYGWKQAPESNTEGNTPLGVVHTHVELRFQRVKHNVFFSSDGEIVNTVPDVYYETPMEEILAYQPPDGSDGRVFAGWYSSADLRGDPVSADDTMPWNDITLYAKWTEPEYTVIFDSRGGTEVSAQENIPKGQKAAEPESPEREGYSFIGWFYETQDGLWKRWSFDQEITRNITLYAVWRPQGTASYTVKHIVEGEEIPFSENRGTGKPGDTIMARALGENDEEYPEGIYLHPDAYTKSISLTEGGVNEIVFVYSRTGLRNYTVHYYLEGTNQSIAPDKVITGTDYSFVTERAEEIRGYCLVEDGELIASPVSPDNKKYKTAVLKTGQKNEIIFFYSNQGAAVIVPASVTIYMGGHGYEGAATEDGNLISNVDNGFPEPGFIIQAPTGVDSAAFEPSEAVLRYETGEEIRRWRIVSYDGVDGIHPVYRFEPMDGTAGTPVRMLFTRADGSVVTEDEFTITDHLDQDLTMEVYGEGIEAGQVVLEYQGKSYPVTSGTALLRVRSTTAEAVYGEVKAEETQIAEGKPGVVADSDTVYYINDSEVSVKNPSGVRLLFDDIVENNNDADGKTNSQLLEERTQEEIQKREGTDGFQLSTQASLKYQCRYLDLVDTDNGNVWVSAQNNTGYVTVYWPLPEGTSEETVFELFHYKGLHREMGVDEVEGQIQCCEVEQVAVEVTDTHIRFQIPRAGFSPFVLAWESETREEPLPHVGGAGAGEAAAAGAVLVSVGVFILRRRRKGTS